jgi:polyphenol oxidase
MTERADAAFTTRIGGSSLPPFDELNLSFAVGDDESDVRANREDAGELIGRDGDWSVVKQVHGCDVITATDGGHKVEADAHWTDNPDRTLAVLSADCVLLLLIGPERIGVVHAGWRGVIAGVVENAVEATGATEAFAGPAIGPCCFEVGPEVVTAFSERFGPATVVDSRHVDLWTASEMAAKRAGVDVFQSARICTSCHHELFFSHRRDQGRTGRQALLAKIGARIGDG